MRKSTLYVGIASALVLGSGVANAAFTPLADGDYTMTWDSGCFDFGDCVTAGTGAFVDNDQTVTGEGSGIAGDGLMGIVDFTLSGGVMTVTSYNQDAYLGTAGGTFALWDPADGAGMGGTIGALGSMDFSPTGRLGRAASFTYLGSPAWNIDNAADGDGTGVYSTWTTGTQTANATGESGAFSGTGSGLQDAGVGVWTGNLISYGNIGSAWGPFENTQYSESFNITISQIPVPAAVWLFGSGLLGLVGVARRRKAA